jgi:hypothetical protein
VCQGALEAKQAWSRVPVADFNPTDPDPAAFPEVATWLQREVAPTFEAWLADLQALGEPPTGGDAWNHVLTAVEGIVRLNGDQVAAATSAGTQQFVQATNGLHGRLASYSRLILIDTRGRELFDRLPEDSRSTVEERMHDVTAVLDAADSTSAILFRTADGTPVGLLRPGLRRTLVPSRMQPAEVRRVALQAAPSLPPRR